MLADAPEVRIVAGRAGKGRGIDRDVNIIQTALRRLECAFYLHCSETDRRRVKINLFIQNVRPELFDSADVNVLIPNQERFRPKWFRLFGRSIDLVLAKSRYAEQLMGKGRWRTTYIGFISEDRHIPHLSMTDESFLHVAGGSRVKGTELVYEAWRSHPHLPPIEVCRYGRHPGLPGPPSNVVVHYGRQPLEAIVQMQNRSFVHVCPSHVEGFGHSIMEGLSCGAVVITTDAPPMNEWVDDNTGFLCPVLTTRARRSELGRRTMTSGNAIAEAAIRAIQLSTSERTQRAILARSAFERFRQSFNVRFDAIMSEILRS